MPPAQRGPASHLAAHNSSYKRHILLEAGEALPRLMTSEPLLQEWLTGRGHQLLVEPEVRFLHINESKFGSLVGFYWWNRVFGAMRRTGGVDENPPPALCAAFAGTGHPEIHAAGAGIASSTSEPVVGPRVELAADAAHRRRRRVGECARRPARRSRGRRAFHGSGAERSEHPVVPPRGTGSLPVRARSASFERPSSLVRYGMSDPCRRWRRIVNGR